MLNKLIKSLKYKELVEIIYITNNGEISKRKIQVLNINGDLFQAYCFLRKSKRTFIIDNILAIAPIIKRESMVI